MPVHLELEGLINFQRIIDSAISDGLFEAGQDLHDLARQLAPEDSGDLKNSGDVQQLSKTVVEVSFGNNLPDDRAPAQEYGTMYFPAQPFLTPAAKEIDPTFRIKQRLKID